MRQCSFRWADTGRRVISSLLVMSDKDPKDFATYYDDLIAYLEVEDNIQQV